MVLRNLPALIVALSLAACMTVPPGPPMAEAPPGEFVTVPEGVPTPVLVRRDPPADLLTDYRPDALPAWLKPDDPMAASALSEQGAKDLQLLIEGLRTRLAQWKAWATAP